MRKLSAVVSSVSKLLDVMHKLSKKIEKTWKESMRFISDQKWNMSTLC